MLCCHSPDQGAARSSPWREALLAERARQGKSQRFLYIKTMVMILLTGDSCFVHEAFSNDQYRDMFLKTFSRVVEKRES